MKVIYFCKSFEIIELNDYSFSIIFLSKYINLIFIELTIIKSDNGRYHSIRVWKSSQIYGNCKLIKFLTCCLNNEEKWIQSRSIRHKYYRSPSIKNFKII
jgi:hypothetical protein